MTTALAPEDAAPGAPADAPPRLGVVAGSGVLPRLVAEAHARAGGGVTVIALGGFADDWSRDWPREHCGLGQVGKLFATLKRTGCRDVCFAGGLARPSLAGLARSFAFDLTGLAVAPRIARLLRRGDDGLLRGLAAIFEERGFRLVSAQSLLSELLAPAGALTRRVPSARDLEDVARAARIVDALGRVDVGQGAVVAQGRCLAVETVQGTDAMLERLAGETRRAGAAIPSGALFKAPKPGQDRRMDLPAIGPSTIERVKAAGLNGVAVSAGAVFLLDPAETIRAADAAGLFVYGAPELEPEPEIAPR